MGSNIAVKIVLLGRTKCGKTCISVRYVKKEFLSSPVTTVAAAYLSKTVFHEGLMYDLNIWDTAGQEFYRSLTPMYYRNAHASIIVYDVTERESFTEATMWVNEVRNSGEAPVVILVGNKVDLSDKREVSTEDGQKLAADLNAKFVESSALTGVGIDLIFQLVLSGINEDPNIKRMLSISSTSRKISSSSCNKPEAKKGCC